jgi:hypothetical protein
MPVKIRTRPRKVKLRVMFAVVCLLLLPARPGLMAAFEGDVSGPVSAGIGGAGIADTTDTWAGFRNPAGAAGRSGFAVGWSRDFELPELTRTAAAARRTCYGIPVSLNLTSFGWTVYRESGIGVAVARAWRGRFTAGAELGGRFLSIQDYGSGTALALAVGVTARASEDLSVAAVWRNANRGRLSGFRDRLAETLVIGAALRPAGRSSVVADLVQERGFPAELRFGAEIQPLHDLALRVGARTEPVRPAAGFTVGHGRWMVHYAGDWHPDLGASHQVGVEFR